LNIKASKCKIFISPVSVSLSLKNMTITTDSHDEIIIPQSNDKAQLDKAPLSVVQLDESLPTSVTDLEEVDQNRSSKRTCGRWRIPAVLLSLAALGLIIFMIVYNFKMRANSTQENPAVSPSPILKAAAISNVITGTPEKYAKVFHVETGRGKQFYTFFL
jgi:hypothetical protein